MPEVVFDIFRILIKTEDIRQCNVVDDFSWGQPIDLFLKDMAKPFFRVRELFLHSLTLIQALDDFRDVQARLHIEVDKGLVRVIETAGVLSFKHIHHLLDHCLRGEDLVGLLRRDIVEDVLDALFVKVIRQFFLEPKEFLHRIIEYHRVKEVPGKFLFLPCLSVLVLTAVTKEPELVKGEPPYVVRAKQLGLSVYKKWDASASHFIIYP